MKIIYLQGAVTKHSNKGTDAEEVDKETRSSVEVTPTITSVQGNYVPSVKLHKHTKKRMCKKSIEKLWNDNKSTSTM